MLILFVYIVLLLIPTVAVIFWAVFVTKRERAKSAVPFTELQRRPAGESARLKMEKHSEDLDTWLMALVFVPIALVLTLVAQSKINVSTIALLLLADVIVAVVALRKIRFLVRERACYRLGFEGERYVAEELNQLMADGFRVFHDVPFDGFNIDHILVGPTGVFVIETKTKKKPLVGGKKQYRVIFDGERLRFPNGTDADAVDQVRRNQKTLSKWLSSATADPVAARGIITTPGWFVERARQSDVHVVSPKEIRQLVLQFRDERLDASKIQRASYQLEQKCKLPIG